MSFCVVGTVPAIPTTPENRACHIFCSNEGKRLVYGTSTGVVVRCLPDQMDIKYKLVESYTGVKKPILVASISPDGNVIAGGDGDGNVYLWKISRDKVTQTVYKLDMQYVRLTDLCFSEDSRRLAVCGVDKYSKKLATCIFVEGGHAMGKVEGHTKGVNSITFRQQRPYFIATAGVDGNVCLHEGPPFKIKATCKGHHGQVHCVRYSPDGNSLASCGDDGKVIFWDPTTGEKQREIDVCPGKRLYALAWSADSSMFAAVGEDRTLRIYDATSNEEIEESSSGNYPSETPVGVAWSKSGWVCVVIKDGRIIGWKYEKGGNLEANYEFVWQGPNGSPSAIGVNHESGRVVVGDSYGSLLFLRTNESEPRAFSVARLPAKVTVKCVLLGNEMGCAVTNDGHLRFFQMPLEKTDKASGHLLPPGTALGQMADENVMVTRRKTFMRTITNMVDGHAPGTSGGMMPAKEISWLGSHHFKESPAAAAFLDGGKFVAVYCNSGSLFVYRFSFPPPAKLEPIWTTQLHGRVTGVAATLDGTMVAVALVANENYPVEKFGDDRTEMGSNVHLIEMYECDTGENCAGLRFVCTYDLHECEISAISVNESGSLLASVDTQRYIRVTEVETGEVLISNEWKYHTSRVTCLDWSPDGTKLASGSVDRDVYVWDIETKMKQVQIEEAQPGGVTSVKFLFNNVLASAGGDGTLTVFEVQYE